MERHVHKRRAVDERSSAPSVVYKRRGGLFRRARCPRRASDIARKAIYNSHESCAVVTKIVLACCPSTPPSSNVKLSQLSIDGPNNKVSLTSTMLITETHKDVPTQAGGDMSAFAGLISACNQSLLWRRGLHFPPNHRQLPTSKVPWCCRILRDLPRCVKP